VQNLVFSDHGAFKTGGDLKQVDDGVISNQQSRPGRCPGR
jgi:hypothetical protein